MNGCNGTPFRNHDLMAPWVLPMTNDPNLVPRTTIRITTPFGLHLSEATENIKKSKNSTIIRRK